jgi:hypothetical protein
MVADQRSLLYLHAMKRSTPVLDERPSACDAPHEVVVIIPAVRPARRRTVCVEWRDAAGELHREVLSPLKSRAWLNN